MTQGALPNHKNPWFEPRDHGIGRSRGGLTTKLHLVCDGRGRPLGMVITGGNVNDTTMMTAVLEDIRVPRNGKGRPRTRPDRVLADKGCPASSSWQDFLGFECRGGGVGQAQVHLLGPVP